MHASAWSLVTMIDSLYTVGFNSIQFSYHRDSTSNSTFEADGLTQMCCHMRTLAKVSWSCLYQYLSACFILIMVG